MECKARNVTVAVNDNSDLGLGQDDADVMSKARRRKRKKSVDDDPVLMKNEKSEADGAVAAGEPDGWNCEVEKRCVCLSCTMGSSTDEVSHCCHTVDMCSRADRAVVCAGRRRKIHRGAVQLRRRPVLGAGPSCGDVRRDLREPS